MSIISIEDLPIEGERVFIRVDFNVPINKNGQIEDTTRIDAALPTIKHALRKKSKIILASHLGRPGGKINKQLSLEPVGKILAEKLDTEVILSDYPVGDVAEKLAQDLGKSKILLLENLRFDPGEKKNDPAFAKKLAGMAEIYVNDAFGTAHRAHASTAGMVSYFDKKGAGFLLTEEIRFFQKLLKTPEEPFLAILGGAKVSDKIGVIKNLLDRVQSLIIGGAMANTFLSAVGVEMGNSRVEKDKMVLCKELINSARARNIKFLLPKDLIIAEDINSEASDVTTLEKGVPENMMALDIGPASRKFFAEEIQKAQTIFWNGPMGVFENSVFARGTNSIAKNVAENKGLTVAGGGDSVSAINKAGFFEKFNHISTGGGASLEMMEGKNLPGIMALL
ncbi:MAG: phosphoglycerate kinase [Myxococcota bacterium]